MELVSIETDEGQKYGLYVRDCFQALGFVDKIIEQGSYLFEADYHLNDYDPIDLKAFEYYKSIGEPMPRLTRPTIRPFVPKYINITELSDMCNYGINFHGCKLIPPELAEIAESIMNSQEGSLQQLLNYENNEELTTIDEEIEELEKEAEGYNIKEELDEKIRTLSLLKARREAKERGEFYNVELLKRLYYEFSSMVYMRALDENDQPYGDYVSINQYKRMKQGKAKELKGQDAK